MKTQYGKNRSGFTTLELMIVLVIVAILVLRVRRGTLIAVLVVLNVSLAATTAVTMSKGAADSGIGGAVAEMVGRRLNQVGGNRQVLCVTHLPQVASVADHHYRIHKMTDGKSTRTGIARLGNDERIEELARMLGGVAITKTTREHAAEMLASGSRGDGNRKESA